MSRVLQQVPEIRLQADAGLVSSNNYRPFCNRRLHDRPSQHSAHAPAEAPLSKQDVRRATCDQFHRFDTLELTMVNNGKVEPSTDLPPAIAPLPAVYRSAQAEPCGVGQQDSAMAR